MAQDIADRGNAEPADIAHGPDEAEPADVLRAIHRLVRANPLSGGEQALAEIELDGRKRDVSLSAEIRDFYRFGG